MKYAQRAVNHLRLTRETVDESDWDRGHNKMWASIAVGITSAVVNAILAVAEAIQERP